MTDEQIIKALECCAGDDGCDVCPMYKPSSECITELQGKALDLINRQKAEVERLKEQVNLWQEEAGSVGCANEWLKASLKNAKAEAIKEFNARIYAYKTGVFIKGEELIIIPMSDYNEILKEMVGDAE